MGRGQYGQVVQMGAIGLFLAPGVDFGQREAGECLDKLVGCARAVSQGMRSVTGSTAITWSPS